ncbi:MAG: hypothetical protein CME67_03285 [Halobacteriovoraceae bacterium]|nr:hypothetical protein [Halobacteriovoraceae bacterium]|tara:strand:- start:8657 stop:9001 length:345 start_codon:yes stop_codon:yes gene_type:complete
MKTTIATIFILLSFVTAASEVDYSAYSDPAPLDRYKFHDRGDIEEVRKYDPSSKCSDHKREVVAQALQLESVLCTLSNNVVYKIKVLEEVPIIKVVKVVGDEVLYYYKESTSFV